MNRIKLSPFSEVVRDFSEGKMVIIVDDDRRENEGDLTIATEAITPEAISFMAQYARGLICVSISSELAERFNLPLQVINNNSPFNTSFTISIDHRDVADRGILATSRAYTMKRLLDPTVAASDFLSPGHVIPLIAHPSGVIGRQGQTEGSFDLSRIAKFKPSGVICEILNDDGTMARGDALSKFAKQHGIKITSIADIIAYRVREEILVRAVAEADLDTDEGRFRTYVFEDDADGREHLALVFGDINSSSPPFVRIHSECLTGDVFGSRRCDCGGQLTQAMKQIVTAGNGVLLYLRQEGRGIGLGNKLRAYELQDQGHDTVEANVRLGFAPDARDFAVAAKILEHFGIQSVKLLTNNPNKLETLEQFGISVVERVPLLIPPNEFSRDYLSTKREKLGHLL